jgi:hypothetical protein
MSANVMHDAGASGGEDVPSVYATTHEHATVRVTPKESAPGTRVLANEVPVAVEFDGQPYAVMMLTLPTSKISRSALPCPSGLSPKRMK